MVMLSRPLNAMRLWESLNWECYGFLRAYFLVPYNWTIACVCQAGHSLTMLQPAVLSWKSWPRKSCADKTTHMLLPLWPAGLLCGGWCGGRGTCGLSAAGR